MRVLVVDQYATSPPGRAAWKRFFRCVVAGFDAQNIHANFSVRRGAALGDFIYLPDSAFVDPKSLKNFDRIDMVFVGGSANHRPWSPRIRQVLILLRMCFLTNKCVFASTFACGVYVDGGPWIPVDFFSVSLNSILRQTRLVNLFSSANRSSVHSWRFACWPRGTNDGPLFNLRMNCAGIGIPPKL